MFCCFGKISLLFSSKLAFFQHCSKKAKVADNSQQNPKHITLTLAQKIAWNHHKNRQNSLGPEPNFHKLIQNLSFKQGKIGPDPNFTVCVCIYIYRHIHTHMLVSGYVKVRCCVCVPICAFPADYSWTPESGGQGGIAGTDEAPSEADQVGTQNLQPREHSCTV